jgi:hypothetical protein
MKKYLLIFVLFLSIIPAISAHEGERDPRPRLSPAEFRAKMQEFITRDAGLTDDEAARFFPLYFKLDDQRRAINDRSWQLVHQGDNDNLSEAQYKGIIDGIYSNRIAIDKLEKEYTARFHKIVSYKKILRIHRSEIRFNRFLLREMRNKKN